MKWLSFSRLNFSHDLFSLGFFKCVPATSKGKKASIPSQFYSFLICLAQIKLGSLGYGEPTRASFVSISHQLLHQACAKYFFLAPLIIKELQQNNKKILLNNYC